MKVIVLGGAGDMGSAAVKDLAKSEEVDELMIADYNVERARELAGELGSKCNYMKVDANSPSDLKKAIEGYDVAASAIGPFYKYEVKVARGALDAGVNYVSICDDYDAATALFDLDSEAKKKGITILTGLGWTPGMSNVVARLGADKLDQVEEIAVAWAGSASDSEGYAVVLHTVHIFAGFIPSFQNGRVKMVGAGTDREKVRFPSPIGEIYVYNLGHPEPVTIPRFLNVRTVTLKGGLTEDYMNLICKLLAMLHLTTTPERKDRVVKVIEALMPLLTRIEAPENPCSGLRVDVTGIKDGEWQRTTYGAAAHMWELTGIPLAIGVLMLGRGQIKKKGVVAPEAAVDPKTFLSELGKRNIKVYEGDDFGKALN